MMCVQKTMKEHEADELAAEAAEEEEQVKCRDCDYSWGTQEQFDLGKGRVAFSAPTPGIEGDDKVCSLCEKGTTDYVPSEDEEETHPKPVRQLLTATYDSSFKIPEGVDLHDTTVVKNYNVRHRTLYIEYVDGRTDEIEETYELCTEYPCFVKVDDWTGVWDSDDEN
jgi:hypothetical protein